MMEYLYHIAIVACLYVILATSFNLTIGMAGLFALAHACFYAMGAYAVAILSVSFGIGFPFSMIVGVIAAAVVGMIVALPALRIGGHYLVIVTLAFQVIVTDVLRNAKDVTGGPEGIAGVGRIEVFGTALSSPGQFLPVAVLFALLCYLVARRIELSPFGRALRAMREDERAAQSVGKNIVSMKLTAFAVSAGLAAVAGALLAHYIAYVGPQTFTVNETITILAMVILGGTGNLLGSVVGAVVLVILPELLKLIELPPVTADMLRNALYGILLIVILRVRPEGLLPETHNLPRGAGSRSDAGALAAAEPAMLRGGEGVRLEARDLVKSFGGIVAADHVDIVLEPGVVNGLIGPNGAGKTTTFNLLTGFLPADSGSILLGGTTLSGLRPHRIVHHGIARSFQDLRLFRGLTVLENVLVALPDQSGDDLLAVFARPRKVRAEDRANVDKAMQILVFIGLDGKALERVDNLSFAEEKLLVIARLLATGAEVLLLDEPLSGLDLNTLREILPVIRRLAEQGRTICLIEHNLEVIREVCDRVFYLDEGRVLAAGTPDELMANPELQERYLK